MAKKKSILSKSLTFITTVAAIGGTCYIFRDKIKQSSIYKTTADKCSKLWNKWNSTDFAEDEEDFFLEDEDNTFDDVFSEEEKKNREYTSITINPKEEEHSETTTEPAEDIIPTIAVEENENTAQKETKEGPETVENITAETDEQITGYENEGLSDVSEDPDVLEEQDQLDF